MIKSAVTVEVERIDVSKMTLLEFYDNFKDFSWEHWNFKVEDKKVFLVSTVTVIRE